ncbi:uncharacterized protein LOC132538094 isoform X4 [Erinaceus europaeus]|uniref:Uncharacterized protein LOC132538094 isoform X4 n=1 Tax=Erinaceus europaeus TaxID=9365 RepID=A0ABM3XAG5_ERIEU|nr:uncharacterized protein LOC132538094 isoform X4 [Erinaceus europaeus]
MAESKAATSEQGSHFAVRGSGGRRQFVGGRGRRGSNQRGSFPVRGAHDGNGPWQQWPRQQRRPSSRGPRRPRAGTAGGALHRPEDGSEGESHPECSSGAPSPSRGRGRRPRRPRADMGHRGRRSPPAPPRGCIFYRFPPPLARLLPRPSRAGFRARRRGVSRADFARYVREDPFEDSGHETEGELQRERQREKEKQHSTASPLMKFPLPVVLPCGGQGLEPRSSQMTQSPGLRYDSLDHTLRITVGNNYFRYVGIPAQQHLSDDGLVSPVNNLEVLDSLTVLPAIPIAANITLSPLVIHLFHSVELLQIVPSERSLEVLFAMQTNWKWHLRSRCNLQTTCCPMKLPFRMAVGFLVS